MKNRDKILHASTRLFNESGFVNVRLQHISDDTIISVGNIAYHFRNKEAIVSTIFEQMQQEQKEVLLEYRHTPIFANVDRIFHRFEQLQTRYSFFYTDTIEIKRAYPQLFEQISQFFSWQELLFVEMIRFNISRGALREDLEESEIKFLASFLTQNVNGFKSTYAIWHDEEEPAALNLSLYAWNILRPYMTTEGRAELEILQSKKVKLIDQSTDESRA